MARKRKRTAKLAIPSSSPVIEVYETDAVIVRLDAPLLGTIALLPTMLCNECQHAGVFVISVHCPSCGHVVKRIACMRSNATMQENGAFGIVAELLSCNDCLDRDEDTAPPVSGGVFGVMDPRRLN